MQMLPLLHPVQLLSFQLLAWSALAAVLDPLVDVKGNGAIRQIRLLYDIYEQPAVLNTSGWHRNNGRRRHTAPPPGSVLYPWTAAAAAGRNQQETERRLLPAGQTQTAKHRMVLDGGSHHYYRRHYLVRGRPMFAEIDFVPRYIPQRIDRIAVSVTLPGQIRGRPWVLGYHQEPFREPECPLCTNEKQSYTIPVTLFLPDDGWCPEGRVPTIWKIEAPLLSPTATETNNVNRINQRPEMVTMAAPLLLDDQTDRILAYGYDQHRQLDIRNHNTSNKCAGRKEFIIV